MFSPEALEIVKNALGDKFKEGSYQTVQLVSGVKQRGLNIEGVFELRGDQFIEDLVGFETSIENAIEIDIQRLLGVEILKVPNTSSSKASRSKHKVRTSYGLRDKKGRFISPINLTRLINLSLDTYAKRLMGRTGRLKNRTGRLANSGRILSVESGARNSFKFIYDYMRKPYETFEPYGKMGSDQRSPAKLFKDAINLALKDLLSRTTVINKTFEWRRR